MVTGTALVVGLQELRAFRRELEATDVGQHYVRLLEQHSAELLHLMVDDQALRIKALEVLGGAYEIVRSRHQSVPLAINAGLVRATDAVLEDLVASGSPELRATATELRAQLAQMEGKTLIQGLNPEPLLARKAKN